MSTATPAAAVNPLTGEVVGLAQSTQDLAKVLARFDADLLEAAAFRRALVDELVGRLDRANKRKARIDDVELETNAPTEVDYRVDVLADGLKDLVEAGKIEPEVAGEVIKTPAPKVPEPKVYKAEVNKLVARGDQAITAVIVKARVVKNVNRTLKVNVREDA